MAASSDENIGFIGFRLSYTCHKLDYYILDPKYDVCAIVNLESRDEIAIYVYYLKRI